MPLYDVRPKIITSLSDRGLATGYPEGFKVITTGIGYSIESTVLGGEWTSTGSSDSIADRPSAALFGKGTWLVAGKFMFVSDGSSFRAAGPFVLHENTAGFLVPSLAAANASTYSQSGNVITVTNGGASPVAHNIPDVTNNGYSVYLAMGVAATGATIPAGWFTNFTYIDANTFSCVSATSQTGTGAVNTNLASTNVTSAISAINGGLLGKQGSLDMYAMVRGSSSAGTKFRLMFGGVSVMAVVTATLAVSKATESIWNLNSESIQGSTINATTHAVNTAADFSITPTLIVIAANEYSALVGLRITVYSKIV